MTKFGLTSLLIPLLALASFVSLPAACGGATDAVDTGATADEIGAEEQSFSDYDATDAELTSASDPDAHPSQHTLTFSAIPAPRLVGLSWKRPGGLARRTLVNNGLGLNRSLGHAGVRVECASADGRPAGAFQGSVVDTGDDFRTMVLEEKVGLGVLFRTVPGALEKEEGLQSTLDRRYENGRASFIRFAISSETCHGLLDYAKAFEAENVAQRYGFVRPLHREGAGCSAFSMAFLELAQLDEPRFRDAWSFDVRVPMKLIGGTDNPGNRVTVLELFTTFRPWAREDEPHMRLAGWDPTKMYTSIRSWAKAALRDHSAVVEKRGRVLGLFLDRRNVAPRAELSQRTFWAGEPGAPHRYWTFGDP